MLRNLSWGSKQLSGLGVFWNGHLLIMTESWVAVGIIPARTSCHCAHCAPHYKSTTLGLLQAPMLPQCMPPYHHHFETLRSAPKWGRGGFFWLTGDPGLGWVGRPRFTRLSPGGRLSLHAGLCNECTLDSRWQGCEVWWLYNDGHFYGNNDGVPIWKGQAGY